MPLRTRIQCKDCPNLVYITEGAQQSDLARGLSAPERCPECRKKNRQHIQSTGQAYWNPPLETDDTKRCWGKFGLGRIQRNRPDAVVEEYHGIPVEAPLWWLANPNDPRIRQEHLELSKKFSTIAPVAKALVDNLLAPNGKRVSILVGPTGTGKSTWVPYALLRSDVGKNGRILVTQPRTITLRKDGPDSDDPGTTPGYIASQLMGVKAPWLGAGQEIGFQYQGVYDQKDAYTRLLFVTDGTLINWIQSGEVGEFGVVMIDEAHEQSVNMVLILALLKQRLAMYPHLRLVIASATVDVDAFSRHFGGIDAVFVAQPDDAGALAKATPFAICDRFLDGSVGAHGKPAPELDFAAAIPREAAALVKLEGRDRLRAVPAAVAALVFAICTKPNFTILNCPTGDILVFVPRIDDVDKTIAAVQDLNLDLAVHACHAQLDDKEYALYKASDVRAELAQKRGQPTNPQRVIVATTFAETSVTMSNLRFVIDAGLVLQVEWDTRTCSTTPVTRWHSQDGCQQRKGRVGRVQTGECFRLYTAGEHARFLTHTPPEITRVPLDNFLLKAKASGIDDLESFDWLGKNAASKQQTDEIARAVAVLKRSEVVDKDGDVTRRGVELSGFQTSAVDLSLCMSESDAFACALEMATFLGFLQPSQRPFARGEAGALSYARWRKDCFDDLELYLRLFHQWDTYSWTSERRAAEFSANGINVRCLNGVEEGRKKLLKNISRRTHEELVWRALDLTRLHRLRLVIARCIPEWIYVRDASTNGFRPYAPERCPCPDPVFIDDNSSCLDNSELRAFVCIGRTQNSKGKVFAQHIIRLSEGAMRCITASPLALSVAMHRLMKTEEAVARASTEHVRLFPRPLAWTSYPKGQVITLRIIKRAVSDDGDETVRSFLCAEIGTESICVATFDVERGFASGSVVQVETIAHADGNRVRVSQKPIIERTLNTQDAKIGLEAIVTGPAIDTREGRNKLQFGVYVSLVDTGIDGVLSERDMVFSERKIIMASAAGSRISVVMIAPSRKPNASPSRTAAERPTFMTLEASKGRMRKIASGDTFTAIVVGFTPDDGQEPTDALLELAPGMRGVMHYTKAADGTLRDTELEDIIKVRVISAIDDWRFRVEAE